LRLTSFLKTSCRSFFFSLFPFHRGVSRSLLGRRGRPLCTTSPFFFFFTWRHRRPSFFSFSRNGQVFPFSGNSGVEADLFSSLLDKRFLYPPPFSLHAGGSPRSHSRLPAFFSSSTDKPLLFFLFFFSPRSGDAAPLDAFPQSVPCLPPLFFLSTERRELFCPFIFSSSPLFLMITFGFLNSLQRTASISMTWRSSVSPPSPFLFFTHTTCRRVLLFSFFCEVKGFQHLGPQRGKERGVGLFIPFFLFGVRRQDFFFFFMF